MACYKSLIYLIKYLYHRMLVILVWLLVHLSFYIPMFSTNVLSL